MPDDDARLIELEIKVTYLERLVDQLNDVVTEQSQRIDRLGLRIERLEGHHDDGDEVGSAPPGQGLDRPREEPASRGRETDPDDG